MSHSSRVLAICATFGLLSCKSTGGSSPYEAPDNAGQPARLGIDKPYSWASVKNATEASLAKPWSDTYWPTASRSVAWRWAAPPDDSIIPSQPLSLSESVSSLLAAAKAKDQNKIAYLSPAEKYDLLLGKVAQIDTKLLAEIEAPEASLPPETKALILGHAANLKNLAREMQIMMLSIDDLVNQLRELAPKLTEAFNRDEVNALQELRKQWDELSKQLDEKVQEQTKLGESYKIATKKIRDLRRPHIPKEVNLARSLSPYLPMTADSWNDWNGMEQSSIDDYGWMGLCHGWAPAAMLEPIPKHAVLAHKGDLKILFTEGDIRGLLTKLWADQAPGSRFGARRCNSDKVITDNLQRVIDGRICSGENCNPEQGQTIYIKNNNTEFGHIEYRTGLGQQSTKFAYFESRIINDQVAVKIFNNAVDMAAYVSGETPKTPPQPGHLHLSIGCRDVNPMTLHLALVKLLKEKKQGFVFDKDRNSQVWNQPVHGYKFRYLPIRLKPASDNKPRFSVAGEPVAILEIDDPLAAYRAPGTAYLVSVHAEIRYGLENGPKITYDPDGRDEISETFSSVYTLELDAAQNIIGGEWGQIPSDQTEIFELINEQPDFLWYPEPNTKPADKPIDLAIIRKLQSCAEAPVTGKTKLTVYDEERATATTKDIPYADCQL